MKVHLPPKVFLHFLKYFLPVLVVMTIAFQFTGNALGQDTEPVIQVSDNLITFALWVKILSVSGIAFGWVIALLLLWLSTKSPDNPAFQQVISKGLIINLTTVALLVETVLILGILRLINSEAIASILSGIAGYVLGSTRSLRQDD